MNAEYTGRHFVVTAKLKAQAETAFARIARYVDASAKAHVILTEDKYRKIAEVTLNASHEAIVATCEATEMEAALHDALHKLEQQVVKHKDRFETVTRNPRHSVVNELEARSRLLNRLLTSS